MTTRCPACGGDVYDGRAHRCVKSSDGGGEKRCAQTRDGKPKLSGGLVPTPAVHSPLGAGVASSPSEANSSPRDTGNPQLPESNSGPSEALSEMEKCDYWNGRKSLSEPDQGPARAEAGGTSSAGLAEGQHLGGPPRPFRRPLAKDRGNTISAMRPWEVERISRATWYRKPREEREWIISRLETSPPQ